jgi:hypothetical protein
LSADDLHMYRSCMEQRLDDIIVPYPSVLHGTHCCLNENHIAQIEEYYDQIVKLLILLILFYRVGNTVLENLFGILNYHILNRDRWTLLIHGKTQIGLVQDKFLLRNVVLICLIRLLIEN